MAHREMIDGVMKELMRGIKIATAPINQHNCAYNDTGAISNTGQCAWSRWGEARRQWWWWRGGVRETSTTQVNVKSTLVVLWLLKKLSYIFPAEYKVRTYFQTPA